MNIIYFTDLPENWKEFDLKKAYKALAIAHHPDKGGCVETFKAIANEYDHLRNNIGLQVSEPHEILNFEDFLASIDPEIYEVYQKIQNFEFSFDMEVVGDWIWITTTKEHKDNFKEIGFKWSRDKKKWYYKPSSYGRFFSKGDKSMDEIRETYGSIKRPGKKQLRA